MRIQIETLHLMQTVAACIVWLISYTLAILDFERKACTFGAHMETAVVRLGGIHKLYTGAFLPSFWIEFELAVDETSRK